MDVTLTRGRYSLEGIFGELSEVLGKRIACTLEYSDNNEAKIPVGIYQCVRGLHLLEGETIPFETFEVINVPGHTGILFHMGNMESESSGCILLGSQIVGNDLVHSRQAFSDFMALQTGRNSFYLTIRKQNLLNYFLSKVTDFF